MLTKILAAALVLLVLGKLFFRPQLRKLGAWLDRLVNVTLIAIAIVYGIQLLLLWNSQP